MLFVSVPLPPLYMFVTLGNTSASAAKHCQKQNAIIRGKSGASRSHATSDVMPVMGSLDTVSGMGCVSYTAATASRRACRSST